MKNNHPRRFNDSSTIKVLFALAEVVRNNRNEIQSVTFSDLRKNKVHFNTGSFLQAIIQKSPKYLEIEFLNELYQRVLNGDGNFIFDLRDIVNAKIVQENEINQEIKAHFAFLLSERDSEVTNKSNKITAKMILRKKVVNERDFRDLASKNKVRYENAEGLCVDLFTNAQYFNNPNLGDFDFIEILVDINMYHLSIKENKERFPHNFFHKFDPRAIKRKENITLDSKIVNEYFEILVRREFGDESVFMGLTETMEAVKLRESKKEVITQPAIVEKQIIEEQIIEEQILDVQPIQPQITEGGLNRYQVGQRARRERERLARESAPTQITANSNNSQEISQIETVSEITNEPTKVTLTVEEYNTLLNSMKELDVLRGANTYNQELLAKLEEAIKENNELKRQNEGLKEVIIKASQNLGVDIRKLI